MAEGESKPWGVLIIVLPFVTLGGLIVAQAMGLGTFVGRALVPNWVLGLAGSTFLFFGIALFAKAFFGAGSLGELFGTYILFAILAIFTYFAFADRDAWIMRIIVVSIDLLVLIGTADWMLGKARGIDSPLSERLDAMKEGEQTIFAAVFLGAPVAIAITLEATGGFERMREFFHKRALRNHPAMQSRPAIPLGSYVGWWETPQFNRVGWVSRFIIRTDGDRKAWIRMWELCPPNHCELGEFPAEVETLRDGVTSLTAEWKSADGMSRKFSVHPQNSGAGVHQSLVYNEGRIRGRDWDTNQSWASAAKRVK